MYPRPEYSGGNKELLESYRGVKRTCNFFSGDIEGYSYFMGFCYADAHMEKDGRGLQIYSSDKEILEQLISRMEFTGPLLVHRKATERYKTIYRFNLGKSMAGYFYDRGLKNNKKNITLPDDIDIYHFLRGFLDGDGSIKMSHRNGRYFVESVEFLAMNRELIEQIQEEIGGSIYKHKNGYLLKVADESKYVLLERMYKNSTIFLHRKYKKYKLNGSIV